jgi:hypothetical protein
VTPSLAESRARWDLIVLLTRILGDVPGCAGLDREYDALASERVVVRHENGRAIHDATVFRGYEMGMKRR